MSPAIEQALNAYRNAIEYRSGAENDPRWGNAAPPASLESKCERYRAKEEEARAALVSLIEAPESVRLDGEK